MHPGIKLYIWQLASPNRVEPSTMSCCNYWLQGGPINLQRKTFAHIQGATYQYSHRPPYVNLLSQFHEAVAQCSELEVHARCVGQASGENQAALCTLQGGTVE